MTEKYLYDEDEIQWLAIAYGAATSTEEKKRIEGQIIEETIETVWPDDAPEEKGFPSGVARLAALIDLRREYHFPKIGHHIEEEIKATRDGQEETVDFETRPLPYASQFDLLGYAAYFEGKHEGLCRYFRLRAFEQMGAFDNLGLLRAREEAGELTDAEREFLETL